MENKLTPLQQAAMGRKLLEAEIVALAWSDETFRAKLETDPAGALTEAGFPLPEGKMIKIVIEAPGTLQITLPAAPAFSAEASEEELAAVAGGGIIGDGKCHVWAAADEFNQRGDHFGGAVIKTGIAIGGLLGFSWGYG